MNTRAGLHVESRFAYPPSGAVFSWENDMADQITISPDRAVDANGNPVSGALAYFYEYGTTAPIMVYSNQELTFPHPNPLQANAAGVFPPVYYGTPGAVKVVVTTPGGVVLPGYPMQSATRHTVDAGRADAISFDPFDDIAAVTVQDAIIAVNTKAQQVIEEIEETEFTAAGAVTVSGVIGGEVKITVARSTTAQASDGTSNSVVLTPESGAAMFTYSRIYAATSVGPYSVVGKPGLMYRSSTAARGVGLITAGSDLRYSSITIGAGGGLSVVMDGPSAGGSWRLLSEIAASDGGSLALYERIAA